MPSLSLTDFADIVSSSGESKATKVAQVKSRPDYAPQFDFYKPLRESIQNLHKGNKNKSSLRELVHSLTDQKKVSNYPSVIEGYLRWLGRKKPSWFDPPRSILSASGVEIVINPELGLVGLEESR